MRQLSIGRRISHIHFRKSLSVVFTLVVVSSTISVTLARDPASQASAASATPGFTSPLLDGRMARTMSIKETAKLIPAGSVGVKVNEKGSASGTIDGTASSNLTIMGNHIGGTFVLSTHSGTIDGRTNATVIGQAAVPVVRFSGSLSIVGGSNSYAHAGGHLSIKGTIRRKNYELAEEVSGTLHY
jgi:hypothetical protein